MVDSLLLPGLMSLVGACGGSFAATTALRALRGEQAIAGRSHCDGCGITLGLAATVPLLSYPALRGACARCGGRIDPAHFAGEAAGALVGAAAFAILQPVPAALVLVLGLVLVMSSIIDHRSERLPDRLTLCVAALSLGLAVFAGRVMEGLVAAVITFAVLETIRRGFMHARSVPGLGGGDVKLLAALALWLGIATPWVVALASAAGLAVIILVRPNAGRISFGPFIAVGSMAVGLILETRILNTLEATN